MGVSRRPGVGLRVSSAGSSPPSSSCSNFFSPRRLSARHKSMECVVVVFVHNESSADASLSRSVLFGLACRWFPDEFFGSFDCLRVALCARRDLFFSRSSSGLSPFALPQDVRHSRLFRLTSSELLLIRQRERESHRTISAHAHHARARASLPHCHRQHHQASIALATRPIREAQTSSFVTQICMWTSARRIVHAEDLDRK